MSGNCIVCGEEASRTCDKCGKYICSDHIFRPSSDEELCPKCFKEAQEEYQNQ